MAPRDSLGWSRRFVGIDIKAEYIEMARKRLQAVPLTLEWAEAQAAQVGAK